MYNSQKKIKKQYKPAPKVAPAPRPAADVIDMTIERIRRNAGIYRNRVSDAMCERRARWYRRYPSTSLPQYLWFDHGTRCPYTTVRSLEPGSGLDVDALLAMRELMGAA